MTKRKLILTLMLHAFLPTLLYIYHVFGELVQMVLSLNSFCPFSQGEWRSY